MGPLHHLGQLNCPYSMQLGPTAGGPRKPGESPRTSKVTYVIIQVGPTQTVRGHWGCDCQRAGSLGPTWSFRQDHYSWGSTRFSTNPLPWCMRPGKVFEICWWWWHWASFRLMSCSHWPVLERPACPVLQTLVGGTAHNSQTHQHAGIFGQWGGQWAPLSP